MPLLHFPTYTTSFIGRETDLQLVSEAVQQHRLVSLVGTSGTGKTRLSLEVARQLESDFPDGCVFVGLAAVQAGEYLIPTVAQALDIHTTTATPPLEQITAMLTNKRMLLILDNVEQIEQAAEHISQLFEHSTQISFLVTSQKPLHVDQETLIRIPPLGIPSSTAFTSIDQLLAYPAVALFVDRIQAIQPTFEATAHNISLIKEISQRLHGLPLALELVAANSRSLPLRDVLLLLKNYLPPLSPDHPLTRAEIIEPVLAWCHKIMTPAQQRIYRRLGIFHGGWTREQAEQVCGPELEAIDSLHQQLLQRHLLLAEQQADGTLRYGMVDAVVEDSRLRLKAAEEREQLAHAHAFAFRDLALKAEMAERSAPETMIEWFERLEAERANVRAALAWAATADQPTLMAEIVSALGRFWITRGDVREAAHWIAQTLAHADHLSEALKASTLYAAGLMDFRLGRLNDALKMWEQSVAWYETQGDVSWTARLWNNLAIGAAMQNQIAEARSWLHKALAARRSQGDQYNEIIVLLNLARTHSQEGEYATALTLYQEALAICKQIGAVDLQATVCGNLGSCYTKLGNYTAAIPLLEESLALYAQSGDLDVYHAHAGLGIAYLKTGAVQQAHPHLQAALKHCLEAGNLLTITEELEHHAHLLLAMHQPERAAQIWALSSVLRTHTGAVRPEDAQLEAALDDQIARYVTLYAVLAPHELEQTVQQVGTQLLSATPA